MSSCKSIREDLDAYRDEILEMDRHKEVDKHLRHCIACSEAINRTAAMEQNLRDNAAYWVESEELWPRIKESASLQNASIGASAQKYRAQLPWAIAA